MLEDVNTAVSAHPNNRKKKNFYPKKCTKDELKNLGHLIKLVEISQEV